MRDARERDAAALLVPHAEDALAKARTAMERERKAAAHAVERERDRRGQLLYEAVAPIAEVLVEIKTLARALVASLGLGSSARLGLDWPTSPLQESEQATFARSIMRRGPTAINASEEP